MDTENQETNLEMRDLIEILVNYEQARKRIDASDELLIQSGLFSEQFIDGLHSDIDQIITKLEKNIL